MRFGPYLRDVTKPQGARLVTWKKFRKWDLLKFRGFWFTFNEKDTYGVGIPYYGPYSFFPKDAKLWD